MNQEIDTLRISGVMMYYYIVCPRKLWYFSSGIALEENNELVQLGKVVDEQTFAQADKHIEIDSVINIDFIKSKKEIHEVKKSRAIEEASIIQVKYYLYYLLKKGVTGIKGVINYPLLKKKEIILLTEEDIKRIENILKDIRQILRESTPPVIIKKKICKSCAYHDLCYL